ncbi:PKD domain-containing protein [Microbulbifer hainanensis]|uniref:PKD domain-containing protein n=1 Tax=Microbulbifer hainanensis TaxID=2735675 RepID=UPI00186646C1|nr:hypothetical protein [Microbulbifer hainanensis]
MFNRTLLAVIIAAGALAGCSDDNSHHRSVTTPPVTTNAAPSVVIQEIAAVKPGAQVTLEAVASDEDDNIASLEWTQTTGTSVDFTGGDTDTIAFIAPAPDKDTDLTFSLTVTDAEGETAMAEVTVKVLANAAPEVSINAVEPVATQQTVILTSTASDDYSDKLEYSWAQLDATEGYEVAITDYDADASFVSPSTKFNKTLKFQVTATDEHQASGTADTEVDVIGDIHAQIKALTDAIVLVDFKTIHADGFMVNDTAAGAGIFKWQRPNTGAAKNITAPIAHFLSAAGYSDIAELAFEDMYVRTSADPTNPGNFASADLGVFLYAYEVTGEQKYLDVATAMWDAVQAKYGFDGANPPRTWDNYPLWGYDSYNQLMGAYMAAKHGLPGADVYLADFGNWYESELPAHLVANPSNAIYTNLIFQEFNLGVRDDSYMLAIDAAEADMQTVAYALMSKTIEKEAAVDYLMDALNNKSDDDYSEPVAEAIGALRTFADE